MKAVIVVILMLLSIGVFVGTRVERMAPRLDQRVFDWIDGR